MRKEEEWVQRLLDELASERRELLKRRALLDQAVRRLDEVWEAPLSRDGTEGEDVRPLLAGVRDEVAQLRGEFLESLSERLRRWTEMIGELSGEINRQVSLSTLGELSASVAHEIRNPLCGILLSIEVLQTKMDADDSRKALLDNLHREAEKMEKVINNLLHFARHYQPRLVRCELAELVMKSIESVKAHLRKNQMEVRIRRSALSCEAEVDPDLVQQVFSNILLNSVDACPKGSSVDVDVRPAADATHIAVAFRDEGNGIRGEWLERIFDPFFTSKPNGIGLGLSVSKKIVEAHNGRIEVASEVGKGATFTVILPLRSSQQDSRAAA